MKLRNKVLAGFTATVLALTLMVGSAFASTKELPFDYPNDANAATNNDVWIKLVGGGAGEQVGTAEIAEITKSVDVYVTGNCSFDPELIFNFDGGWIPTALANTTVDGETVLNLAFPAKGVSYAELIINLKNKTEGPLQISKVVWKDADGNATLEWPNAAAAEAEIDKAGVVSSVLFLGLGAVAFGSGAVVLKKKER